MLSGPRRSLLATALTNVADVTVEMVADDSSIVASVLTELNYSIVNGTLDVSSSPPSLSLSRPPPCSTGAFLAHSWDCTYMLQVMAVIRLPGNVSLFAMQ